MRKEFALRAFATWDRLRRRLWGVEILSCRCVSTSKGRALTLNDAFLGTAETFGLEVLIRRPLLLRKARESLRIRLAAQNSPGNARDTALGDLSVRHLGHGIAQFRASLTRTCWVNREWLPFEIYHSSPDRPLTRLDIRVLDAVAAQQRAFDDLRASHLQLWVRNRTGFHAADTVAGSSGSLLLEFWIQGSEISTFIPTFESVLTIDLVSPTGCFEIHRQPIRVGREILRFRGPAVALTNPELFAQPGNYRLRARIGGREIGQFPFQFVSEAGLLRQITVPLIQIQAQTRAGETTTAATTLNWEEHKGFQAWIEVKSEITAPGTLVPCTVSIRDGKTILKQEEVLFPLDRVSRTIKLQPVEFGPSGLQSRPKPARLSVSVSIDGEEKACASVLVLPPERITNFEGQLSFEVYELPFDELEYDQIVQRLGLPDQVHSRRGLWRWLQTKLS
jgi:hypothetical protein